MVLPARLKGSAVWQWRVNSVHLEPDPVHFAPHRGASVTRAGSGADDRPQGPSVWCQHLGPGAVFPACGNEGEQECDDRHALPCGDEQHVWDVEDDGRTLTADFEAGGPVFGQERVGMGQVGQ